MKYIKEYTNYEELWEDDFESGNDVIIHVGDTIRLKNRSCYVGEKKPWNKKIMVFDETLNTKHKIGWTIVAMATKVLNSFGSKPIKVVTGDLTYWYRMDCFDVVSNRKGRVKESFNFEFDIEEEDPNRYMSKRELFIEFLKKFNHYGKFIESFEQSDWNEDFDNYIDSFDNRISAYKPLSFINSEIEDAFDWEESEYDLDLENDYWGNTNSEWRKYVKSNKDRLK